MKPWLSALVLFAVGCSTHPLADVLDCVTPGKVGKNRVTPYGGVCTPSQGQASPFQPPIAAPGGMPNLNTPPVTVPVIPPPAPLPNSAVAPGGSAIPPPPPPPPTFPR